MNGDIARKSKIDDTLMKRKLLQELKAKETNGFGKLKEV